MTTVADEIGKEVTLGGIGEIVSDQIAERTGKESRCVVLGHLQRGGMPTARDRLLSTRFGAGAVRLVEHGDFGKMVALLPPKILAIPIEDAVSRMKAVPVDGDTVQTARDLGVCLGD